MEAKDYWSDKLPSYSSTKIPKENSFDENTVSSFNNLLTT